MRRNIRRWSDEDITKLKSMAQKYPTAAIAAQLGRSAAATLLKAHELKLWLRVRPEERKRPRSIRNGAAAGLME
jgi:hypothetical protein